MHNGNMDTMSLSIARRFFCKIAKGSLPSQELLKQAKEAGCDIYVFDGLEELDYSVLLSKYDFSSVSVQDNVARLPITTFEEWHREVCRRSSHDYLAKAKRKGLTAKVFEPTEETIRQIYEIYNETPIRQGRSFKHYGMTLDQCRQMAANKDSVFIGAFREETLVGFLMLSIQDGRAIIDQILSFIKDRDARPNNALIGKAVEVCVEKKACCLDYARMGNHPSLDVFKRDNGFDKYVFNRYYILLTFKGRLLTMLRLHRVLKDVVPESLKAYLIPAYSWLSRLRARWRR